MSSENKHILGVLGVTLLGIAYLKWTRFPLGYALPIDERR